MDIWALIVAIVAVGIAIWAKVEAKRTSNKQVQKLDSILLNIRKGDIVEPKGDVIIKVPTAELVVETFIPEVIVEKKTRAAVQKRLDEDTKKVGFVRGEVHELEDGNWAIHWGGKYPL